MTCQEARDIMTRPPQSATHSEVIAVFRHVGLCAACDHWSENDPASFRGPSLSLAECLKIVLETKVDPELWPVP